MANRVEKDEAAAGMGDIAGRDINDVAFRNTLGFARFPASVGNSAASNPVSVISCGSGQLNPAAANRSS